MRRDAAPKHLPAVRRAAPPTPSKQQAPSSATSRRSLVKLVKAAARALCGRGLAAPAVLVLLYITLTQTTARTKLASSFVELEHTLAAVERTLLAGGASDICGGVVAPENGSSIPKLLLQSWVSIAPGDTELPPGMDDAVATWTTLNSGWTRYHVGGEEQAAFMRDHCGWAADAHAAANLLAARSDIFRYCYLYRCGGVWADIDSVDLVALDSFLHPGAELVLTWDGGLKPSIKGEAAMWNGFLAVKRGHPAMKTALDRVVATFLANREVQVTESTGPRLWSRAVRVALGEDTVRESSFYGMDLKGQVQYLRFDGSYVLDKNGRRVMNAKYDSYIEVSLKHGGDPHYGRVVRWTGVLELIVDLLEKKEGVKKRLLKNGCGAWKCSCQQLSDRYGTAHGRDFAGLKDGMTEKEWWLQNKCTTSPLV